MCLEGSVTSCWWAMRVGSDAHAGHASMNSLPTYRRSGRLASRWADLSPPIDRRQRRSLPAFLPAACEAQRSAADQVARVRRPDRAAQADRQQRDGRACDGGLAPGISAPGLGSPRHICTGTGKPCHICAGTGLAPPHRTHTHTHAHARTYARTHARTCKRTCLRAEYPGWLVCCAPTRTHARLRR